MNRYYICDCCGEELSIEEIKITSDDIILCEMCFRGNEEENR